MAIVGLLALVGCMSAATATPPLPTPSPGKIELMAGEAGSHVRYVPTTVGSAPPIVVLVHGTPAEDEMAEDTARYYVENWQNWAEKNGAILIAPAFDQANFGSKDPDLVGGGYRGLFGREIGADEWVIQLVAAYQAQVESGDGRFFLYGHSAGGWFVSRFLVIHPERVRSAVITASVAYPHPNPDVPWPYGLGPLEATLQWTDPPAQTMVNVHPDPETWLKGLTVPTTLIVGLNDLEPQLDWPGQAGKNNRVTIARHWVTEMNVFAAEHGVESRLELSLVPGLGHSSYGLLPHSQQAMSEALER
jgi:pimeloyl-ACP methyl ester carboxylesterase